MNLFEGINFTFGLRIGYPISTGDRAQSYTIFRFFYVKLTNNVVKRLFS